MAIQVRGLKSFRSTCLINLSIESLNLGYAYWGIDERNNVVVKYDKSTVDYTYKTPPHSEQLVLKLPLNSKKQTILKVKRVLSWEPTKELLITIVDEFNRITVEEIGKPRPSDLFKMPTTADNRVLVRLIGSDESED